MDSFKLQQTINTLKRDTRRLNYDIEEVKEELEKLKSVCERLDNESLTSSNEQEV